MNEKFINNAIRLSNTPLEERRKLIEDWLVSEELGYSATNEMNNEYLDWHNGTADIQGIVSMLLSHGGYHVYDDYQEAIDDLYRYSLKDLRKILLADEKTIILKDMNIPEVLEVNIPELSHISLLSYLRTAFNILRLSHSIKGCFSFMVSSFPKLFVTDNRVKDVHISYIRNYFKHSVVDINTVLFGDKK